ncbi:MAG TPA: amidohydrolase family protein [Polyangia bacterium]|nr:amidohydrolase family protein [Polyangia bacterium]
MRALLPALVMGLLPATALSQVTALKAGRLFDPTTGAMASDQVILIEGRTIKAVGKLAIPRDAKLIDLSRSTVLPGLFDAHTHLCLTLSTQGGRGLDELIGRLLGATVLDTTAHRALIGAANAREMLEAGFTTVRDVGNAGNYADTDLRRAVEEGLVPGPTILNAGRIIGPLGGQYRQLQPERPDLGEPEYLYADTADEMRKAVRKNVLFGARVIKIAVDDRPYAYTADDIRILVREAARAGLRVAAHCATDAGARAAADAGVASIEHGYRASTETLRLMKRKGVVLVGTDFTELAAREMGIPEYHPMVVERLRRAQAVGVTMAFGTDVVFPLRGQTRGSLAISFIDSFVEAGIPARTILQSMTINAARLLGVERQRGLVEPGRAADLVAAPGDPLHDIGVLKRIHFVMKDGYVVRQLPAP